MCARCETRTEPRMSFLLSRGERSREVSSLGDAVDGPVGFLLVQRVSMRTGRTPEVVSCVPRARVVSVGDEGDSVFSGGGQQTAIASGEDSLACFNVGSAEYGASPWTIHAHRPSTRRTRPHGSEWHRPPGVSSSIAPGVPFEDSSRRAHLVGQSGRHQVSAGEGLRRRGEAAGGAGVQESIPPLSLPLVRPDDPQVLPGAAGRTGSSSPRAAWDRACSRSWRRASAAG